MFLILFLLLSNANIIKYEYINLTILDQISSNTFPYLPCQNITDIIHTPLLKVSDDFFIPPMSTFILNNIPYGIDNCKSIIFTISYKRSRFTFDPENIVLTLMKGLYPQDNTIFFEKTYPKPFNGWNINVNSPGILILSINIGDLDDNGNEFDLSSSSIIYGTKIWISFYVTLKRDFLLTGLRENMFYWVTYQLPQGGLKHTEIDSPYKFYNNTSNYYFIDKTNLLRKNLTSWTNAQTTERLLDIKSSTYNMAWKVDLLCKQTIHFIDINKTDPPTDIVTIEPPSINITREPTESPSNGKEITLLIITILLIIFLPLLLIFMNIRRCFKKVKDRTDLSQIIVDDIDNINKNSNVILIPKTDDENNETKEEKDEDDVKKQFIDNISIHVEVV